MIWRIMEISEGVMDNTLIDLHNSSDHKYAKKRNLKEWHGRPRTAKGKQQQ